ncbi:glycoside hydrolase family 3 C-terminal domain-containing protein [Qipengyuania sp.]|uniref:glycoside hydrolase family 3 C-terminal domain-containing protein n=1 Tax=Qipengyuania sp. TaxID=2004515 RepID=UPI003AF9D3E9
MVRHPPDHAAERERFIEDLLAIMTAEEKVGQIALVPAPAGEAADGALHERVRRGLVGGLTGTCPADRLATLQRLAIEESRLGIPLLLADAPGRGSAVVMPSPLALATSWSPEMVERAARQIAAEARDRGKTWLLGPEVVLSDGAGEDDLESSWGSSVMLAGHLASAMVRGLQFWDQDEIGVLACLQADHPSWTPRRIDERFAQKLRLAAQVLREAAPASVALGPFPATALDKDEPGDGPKLSIGWPGGFGGIDLAEWADMARAAGQDPNRALSGGLTLEPLLAAVADGRIAPRKLDDVVRRIIGAKYDLGLFHTEAPRAPLTSTASEEEARVVALDAARHSIALLRNNPALLPLDRDSGEILIVGQAAADRKLPVAGAGSEAISLIDGLAALGVQHRYVVGLSLRRDQDQPGMNTLVDADRMAIGMASEAARRAGTVIVVLGEVEKRCEAERTLIEALQATNPNIVLVTLGSRPIDPVIRDARLPCVLHAGGLGSMSGKAIAEVLTGAFAPQGRLPLALLDNAGVGLSFGHGLGYSDFGLGETTVELSHDRVVVSTVLHNVGRCVGTETVQIYLRRPRGRSRTASELADFQRVTLAAGENRHLTFEIGGSQLGRFERDGGFVIDTGVYEVAVGLSEGRAHATRLSLPRAVAEAMGRGLNSGPLPALFGSMRYAG